MWYAALHYSEYKFITELLLLLESVIAHKIVIVG
ncbi:MAG: hypothetical protein ACI9WH_002071, partial [Glaciecola sp.]